MIQQCCMQHVASVWPGLETIELQHIGPTHRKREFWPLRHYTPLIQVQAELKTPRGGVCLEAPTARLPTTPCPGRCCAPRRPRHSCTGPGIGPSTGVWISVPRGIPPKTRGVSTSPPFERWGSDQTVFPTQTERREWEVGVGLRGTRGRIGVNEFCHPIPTSCSSLLVALIYSNNHHVVLPHRSLQLCLKALLVVTHILVRRL